MSFPETLGRARGDDDMDPDEELCQELIMDYLNGVARSQCFLKFYDTQAETARRTSKIASMICKVRRRGNSAACIHPLFTPGFQRPSPEETWWMASIQDSENRK